LITSYNSYNLIELLETHQVTLGFALTLVWGHRQGTKVNQPTSQTTKEMYGDTCSASVWHVNKATRFFKLCQLVSWSICEHTPNSVKILLSSDVELVEIRAGNWYEVIAAFRQVGRLQCHIRAPDAREQARCCLACPCGAGCAVVLGSPQPRLHLQVHLNSSKIEKDTMLEDVFSQPFSLLYTAQRPQNKVVLL
jgi:hypothetical protein